MFWQGVRLGAVTPLLVLALSVAWRYRGRWYATGAAVGAAVVAKLFLWPIVLWLLRTRRLKAAGLALLGAGAFTILAWAIVGFRGLREYPALLRTLSSVEAPQGLSVRGCRRTSRATRSGALGARTRRSGRDHPARVRPA